MFTYLRYFSAISSLIIVLVAFMLGYYFRTLAEDDLEQLVQRNNRALAQGFINSTWKTHWSVLDQLYTIDPAQWRNYREFVEFSKDVFHYFEEIPTAKVNLYTKNGVRILSTDQSEILLTASDASPSLKESFAAAKAGNVRNSVLENVEFSSASGEKKRGTLVQTLVPILSDNYVSIVEGSESTKTETLQGIVEVYYDITPQWQHLKRFQIIGTGGIIGIFMVLIGLLIATSKKAEAIIGRQHEANVELAAQAAAAQAENQNKSQFLANISHELRTPLNAIIGFSEIIKNEVMGTLENTQYQDYIRDIHSSGVHLLSLINDILDYSKAEAGKLELDITEVDATKIIQNSMRLVSPRAEAAEVKLIDAVPREHFVTLTDAKKLKQIYAEPAFECSEIHAAGRGSFRDRLAEYGRQCDFHPGERFRHWDCAERYQPRHVAVRAGRFHA